MLVDADQPSSMASRRRSSTHNQALVNQSFPVGTHRLGISTFHSACNELYVTSMERQSCHVHGKAVHWPPTKKGDVTDKINIAQLTRANAGLAATRAGRATAAAAAFWATCSAFTAWHFTAPAAVVDNQNPHTWSIMQISS
jgi:hypothetical protein